MRLTEEQELAVLKWIHDAETYARVKERGEGDRFTKMIWYRFEYSEMMMRDVCIGDQMMRVRKIIDAGK